MHRLLDLLWSQSKHASQCFPMDHAVRCPACSWWTAHHRDVLRAGVSKVCKEHYVYGFNLLRAVRWLARARSRDVAVAGLAKLRNLPEDHPYLQEEITHVLDQIEEERRMEPGRGLMSQVKEMAHKGNRNRIAIGVVMFIFMQMVCSPT